MRPSIRCGTARGVCGSCGCRVGAAGGADLSLAQITDRLVEAAWSYRHRPRCPAPDARSWQAQVRLDARYRHLTTQRGKRSTVAIARELAGFLGAAVTDHPLITE